MEEPLRPMEPVRWQEIFDDPLWQYEIKWDGVRCLAFSDTRGVRFYGRKGSDWTGRFPALAEELTRFHGVFDGELVVLGDGKPSFPEMLRRLARNDGPVHFMVFDRLRDEDGRDLRALPLPERQAPIAELDGLPSVHAVTSVVGEGARMFQAADTAGLEGVVAKLREAPYQSGKSRFWRKVKCWRTLSCVVLGVERAAGDVRSVRLGLPDGDRVQPIGSVGGLSRKEGEELLGALVPGETVVCRVSYIEWTPDGQVRHPRWEGLLNPVH